MKNFLSRRSNEDGLGFGWFNEMFDDFFKPVYYSPKHSVMKTDVKQNDNGYELTIDMPGFDKKDIALSLQDGYLTVEANQQSKEDDNKNYLRRERSFSCSRSYYVGKEVSEEDVKAKYSNGTLTLAIPKKEQKQINKKQIEIE